MFIEVGGTTKSMPTNQGYNFNTVSEVIKDVFRTETNRLNSGSAPGDNLPGWDE